SLNLQWLRKDRWLLCRKSRSKEVRHARRRDRVACLRFLMTSNAGDFFNIYRHNFARVAVGIPPVRVADPAFNAEQTIALMREAAGHKAMLAVFPELGLSGYSCEDLFQQQALLDASRDALAQVIEATRTLSVIAIVGLPVVHGNL